MARDSQTLGLDREEAVRLLDAAEATSALDHALACLLTLNGLRVSEACAADVADLGVERAHRVLAVDAGVSPRDVQDATHHADPRTTRRYDRARHALDRHATYTLAAHIYCNGPLRSSSLGPYSHSGTRGAAPGPTSLRR